MGCLPPARSHERPAPALVGGVVASQTLPVALHVGASPRGARVAVRGPPPALVRPPAFPTPEVEPIPLLGVAGESGRPPDAFAHATAFRLRHMERIARRATGRNPVLRRAGKVTGPVPNGGWHRASMGFVMTASAPSASPRSPGSEAGTPRRSSVCSPALAGCQTRVAVACAGRRLQARFLQSACRLERPWPRGTRGRRKRLRTMR